jgi:hypothetical protein
MGRNHRVQARRRANELTAGARRTNVIDQIGNEIAGIRDILGVPFRWPICEDGSRRAESRCPREAQETEVLTVIRGANLGGSAAGLALGVVGSDGRSVPNCNKKMRWRRESD